jgi:hypothetical protein
MPKLRGKGIKEDAYRIGANAYRGIFCAPGKSRKLLSGEFHPQCQNFTGPGTRIDLGVVRNFPPYNDIDACSKQHDIDYLEASSEPTLEKRKKLIRSADEKVVQCYNKHKTQESYLPAYTGILSKMALERNHPKLARKAFGDQYLGGALSTKKQLERFFSLANEFE